MCVSLSLASVLSHIAFKYVVTSSANDLLDRNFIVCICPIQRLSIKMMIIFGKY